MPRTRLFLLVVLAALFGVWAWSTKMPAEPGVMLPLSSPAAAPGRTPAVFDLQVTTERLEARRGAIAAAPRAVRRNPFRFGESRASREPRPAQPQEAGASAAVPAIAAAPAVILIGVADRTVDGKSVRVAVVSMADTLYYVAAGDRLGARYETVSVGADAVELRDLTDGTVRRVGLK